MLSAFHSADSRSPLPHQFIDHFREKGIGDKWISFPGYFLSNGYTTLGGELALYTLHGVSSHSHKISL